MLARLNGFDPKKPREADSGDGCGLVMTGVPARVGARDARVATPEDGHERTTTPDQALDRQVRDGLPALAPVRAGRTRPDGEDPVEQQHALLGPRRQVAVARRLDALVVAQLAVDVVQAARQGPHRPLDGEGQADRVPRRRVRILAHDQHLDLRQRPREGPQDQVTGRQEAASRGRLGPKELTQLGDRGLGRREHLCPVGRDQLVERCRGHGE